MSVRSSGRFLNTPCRLFSFSHFSPVRVIQIIAPLAVATSSRCDKFLTRRYTQVPLHARIHFPGQCDMALSARAAFDRALFRERLTAVEKFALGDRIERWRAHEWCCRETVERWRQAVARSGNVVHIDQAEVASNQLRAEMDAKPSEWHESLSHRLSSF